MLELAVLAIFAAALFLCVALNHSLLIALCFGFFLFFGYGLYRKNSFHQMVNFALSGVKTIKNILLTFLLIGIITALWRACGTIPYIVYYATSLCAPQVMVLVTFLMCCLISFLTGTSFGATATIGVICVTMANSMGIPILYTGGAVLSGVMFGDRCSPMSTSALLVSTLTKTDLFRNIRHMVKTAIVPFILTCLIYGALGLFLDPQTQSTNVKDIFLTHFHLHPSMLLPPIVILVLSLCKVNIRITMAVSIVLSSIIALTVEQMALGDLLQTAIFGFSPENHELAQLLSGGGLLSMLNVSLIVCISASFSGMFDGTGLLSAIQDYLVRFSKKTTGFCAICLTSVLTGIIACNQTLAIMMTHQLCTQVEPDNQKLAIHLENTAVVISPLVPWSIAGAVPLATIGAPLTCMLTAVYLYLLPLWNLLISFREKTKGRKTKSA